MEIVKMVELIAPDGAVQGEPVNKQHGGASAGFFHSQAHITDCQAAQVSRGSILHSSPPIQCRDNG